MNNSKYQHNKYNQILNLSNYFLTLASDQKPLAVCCLIIKDDLVLAVSRKNDPNAFGLPGGKVDPGEDPETAAKRELLEETGLIASDLKEVFQMNDGPFSVITFLCSISGDINSTEAGVVKWVEPSVLTSPKAPFSNYNSSLFDSVGVKYHNPLSPLSANMMMAMKTSALYFLKD